MSKCEHGDRITLFCATDACAWREAAGCAMCFKRYHNHLGPTVFLSEEDITAIVKKYNVEQSIKPKCRLLQQTVFSYFTLVKTEITNSIDSVCKNIINQIGYPFLSSTNTIGAYKRLKNKEYRKLLSKQFKPLYEQSIKVGEKDIVREEAREYINQTKIAMEILNNIEGVVRAYQNAIKGTFPAFVHDGSSIGKISEIIKSLAAESLKGSPKSKESEINKPVEVVKAGLSSLTLTASQNKADVRPSKQKMEKNDPSNNRLQIAPFNHMRDVSLDKKMAKGSVQADKQKTEKGKDNGRSPSNKSQRQIPLAANNSIKIQNLKQELTHKEVEINEKKRILIDMMKSKQTPRVSFDKQFFENTNKKDTVPSQPKKELSSKSKRDAEMDCLQQDKSCNDFEEDLSKLESIVKNYAFTKLPYEQISPVVKKFEDQEEVHKKLIVVPKDTHSKLSEFDSPIYKTRSIISKMEESRLKEHPLEKQQKSTDSNIASAHWAKPGQAKKQQVLQLKQNQEKSLALLLKSLHLKAEEAVTYLESALRYADNNLSVAEYLSYIYLQLNRPQDCLVICNKMLERIKNSRQSQQLSVILINNKSAAFNLMGRYSQSVRILQQCLKYKEKDSLYKNLGDAYFSLSIYEKAIYNYEKAVKLNDSYDEVHYNMAVCLYIQQNYHNAKLCVRSALAVQPKNETYLCLCSNIESRLLHF